jgi:hypothetical protein
MHIVTQQSYKDLAFNLLKKGSICEYCLCVTEALNNDQFIFSGD